ncbi:MAG TPA: hypothetical protein VGD88_00380 [Opitutaceae bacterium]
MALVLAASFLLRLLLAWNGGQGYWPDESRYQGSKDAVFSAMAGNWEQVGFFLLGQADHPLFRWVGLPAALGEYFFGPSPFLVSAYFSLFSVAALYLVGRVARRAGASEREAVLAVLMMAGAGSMAYFSRHYFPYDCALCCVLLALDRAVQAKSGWDSFMAGIVAAGGFLVYNGYWLLAGGVLVLHVVDARTMALAARRLMWSSLGLITGVGTFVGVAFGFGYNLVDRARANAGTITQGDFGDGARLMGEYLWWADGIWALVWAAALLVAGWQLAVRRAPRRLFWWVGGAVWLSLGLVVLSDVIPVFVVYGRLVRGLVPFLCLVAAWLVEGWLARITEARAPQAFGAVSLAAVVLACINLFPLVRQTFPVDFLRHADLEARRLQAIDGRVYRAVNAGHLWGEDLALPVPAGETVLWARHPLQYLPYQYEGFSRDQRSALRQGDPSMRLVRLQEGSLRISGPDQEGLAPYPGPLRLKVRFPAGATGRAEPLVTAGVQGAGSLIYVVYEDNAHIRLGFDNWGLGGVVSEPIGIDYGREHELMVSTGSLLPPPADTRGSRAVADLSQRLLVILDGVVVLARRMDFHPTAAADIVIGRNPIGATSARTEFTGVIAMLERISPSDMVRRLPSLPGLASQREPIWAGAVGPLKLTLHLGPIRPGLRSPLYSSRTADGGQTLWLEQMDETRIRVGLEHMAEDRVRWSEPVDVRRDRVAEVVLSLGELWPPPASPFFAEHQNWLPLASLTWVMWDRRIILRHQEIGPVGSTIDAALFRQVVPALEQKGASEFVGVGIQAETVDPDWLGGQERRLSVVLPPAAAEWDGFSGPIEFILRMPDAFPTGGMAEPVVVSGVSGAGDFVNIHYPAGGGVRIGYDHWGRREPVLSDVLDLSPGREYRFTLSAGFLFPPETSPLYQRYPEFRAAMSQVKVQIDGRTILAAEVEAHRTRPEDTLLGLNLIGGSTTSRQFSGSIRGVRGVAEPLESRGADGLIAP